MGFYIGLDSGGTKTECWLGDEQRVLARAVCGTVKLTRVAREVATVRLRDLLLSVSAESGVSLAAVGRTCVGVAGFGIPEVRAWAERVVGELVGGVVEVCGDDEIALDAAFREGAGILVIGGTGAIALGRCGQGKTYTAGGWGPAVGDEGSGFWIGREAVREALRARDRGVATGLLEAVRVEWGMTDVGTLVGFANERPGPDFAGLVPVVVQCAEAGDGVAVGLLERAGVELADAVSVVWGKMQAAGESAAEVAFTGSVVEKIGLVREGLRAGLPRELRLRERAVDAMEGAMWRARRGGVPSLV